MSILKTSLCSEKRFFISSKMWNTNALYIAYNHYFVTRESSGILFYYITHARCFHHLRYWRVPLKEMLSTFLFSLLRVSAKLLHYTSNLMFSYLSMLFFLSLSFAILKLSPNFPFKKVLVNLYNSVWLTAHRNQ